MHAGLTAEGHLIESLFQIPNKERDQVDFILNDEQLHIDQNMTGRDIIPKARQMGVTSYWLARFTAACILKENTNAVVISHEADATARQLQRVHYYLRTLKGPKAKTGSSSANQITFPNTNSTFYIGTAGSRAFGRGDTITHLLCTEYAFWPDGPGLLGGLLESVPMTGEAVLESTGNGKGNDYHKRCMDAYKGQSYWNCHFLPWHKHADYRLDLAPEQEEWLLENLRDDWEEPELVGVLDAGQLAWRRMKLADKGYDLELFKQEYPMTLDECFKSTGHSLFTGVKFVKENSWTKLSPNSEGLMGHPKPGHRYSLGADIAAGVGKDESVASIWDVDDEEEVCNWHSHRISPEFFARKCVELAHYYNDAFMVPEANNHGILFLSILLGDDSDPDKPAIQIYPDSLIYRKSTALTVDDMPRLSQFGFVTNNKTKPLAIGLLRKALKGDWIIHSQLLSDQLDTFVEDPETKQLQAQEGQHDDHVIAAALAQVGVTNARMLDRRVLRKISAAERLGLGQFSLETMMKDLRKRGGNNIYPIRSGLRGDS